jgi:hypothetical protein
MSEPSRWEASHILSGRALLRLGEPDLESDHKLWASLWRRHGRELLINWVKTRPCERPRAWYKFSAKHLPPRDEDETDADWLYRCGCLSGEEIAALCEKAKAIAAFNSQHMNDGNRIGASDEIRLAIEICPELTPDEICSLDDLGLATEAAADHERGGQKSSARMRTLIAR